MIYQELCLEQAEVIEQLSSQVRRLLTLLAQYTDIQEEEQIYEETEKRVSRK